MCGSFQQGSLDGLCGLYSAINAVSSLINLTEDDCVELFRIGLEHLASRTNLKKTILEGMRVSMVKEICNRYKPLIEDWGYKLEISQICKEAGNIRGVATIIRNWVNEDMQCVIVGLGGRIEHWTCVTEPFLKSIKFSDSDGLKRLHLCYITTGNTNKNRQYTIDPEEVLGLRLIPLEKE